MKTTPWIVYDGYCAMRAIEGSDAGVIANRVAFIEKAPRVRFAPWTDFDTDCHNWKYGTKGPGGGDPEKDETYGFCPASRAWCDARLLELGYQLG